VTYWKGAEGERIFHFVRDRVYAIDAKSGALIASFGQKSFLRQNLGVDPAGAVTEMTSPGAVFRNVLIIASRVNEGYAASPGHIRAYDTVSGEMKWIFHTIPLEGQFGHDTWTWVKGENYGGANAWGGVTIDEPQPGAPAPVSDNREMPAGGGWIQLFDGSTLNGWVHMNGAHNFTVEDGAIVGRRVESSASMNSFQCSLQEFDDFELELETTIDPITNSGIQIRTQVRPVQGTGGGFESAPGRVNGPQVEIRRFYKGQPPTGVLYGEALGTG
jgi:hypothetical protein